MLNDLFFYRHHFFRTPLVKLPANFAGSMDFFSAFPSSPRAGLTAILALANVCLSALMIWKSFMVLSDTSTPIVVVLTGSMVCVVLVFFSLFDSFCMYECVSLM